MCMHTHGHHTKTYTLIYHYTHIHTHTHTTHIHTTHTHTKTHPHTHVEPCMHIAHTCSPSSTHKHTHIHTIITTHTYILHTHTHSNTHTHIHTHTQTPPHPLTHSLTHKPSPLTETAVCESDSGPVVGAGCYGEVLLLVFQCLLKVASRLIGQANVAIGTTYNSTAMTSITGCQIRGLMFSFNITFLRLQHAR